MSKISSKTTPNFFYSLMPVYPHEKTQVITLCLLKFLASFVFIMLKLQKESNVVVLHNPEQYAFFKSCVFPITLLLVAAYTSLSNVMSQKNLFYTIIFFFLFFLGLYSFVLIPNKDHLTPTTTNWEAKWSQSPTILSFIHVYKYWIHLIFFCFSELFGQFCIILLFWSIANEMFSRKQAKRIYHLFIAAGCLGSIVGSTALKKLTEYIGKSYSNSKGQTEAFVDQTSRWVGIICIGIIFMMHLVCIWIFRQPNMLVEKKALDNKKEKRLSFVQALRYIASNKYLLATTLLIISCAMTTTLVDITYKKYVKYAVGKHNKEGFTAWRAQETFWMNLIAIFSGFFITHRISRRFSWRFNAFITPAIIGSMGLVFFSLSFWNNTYGIERYTRRVFDLSPYYAIALLGYFQSIASIFAKYVFFDATKETMFIVLGPVARRKGKAAADIAGSRLGKGLSSYIHIIILTLFSVKGDMAVESVSHVLLIIFTMFCLIWFACVQYLAPQVDRSKSTPHSTHIPNT